MPVFDIQSLTKRYASTGAPANQDISIQIRSGEVFGLLGDNGAGKTTLVKQMVNLLRPDTGRILFRGHPIHANPLAITQQVAYMPQTCQILSHLTVGEVIFHTAFLRGLPRRAARTERDRLLRLLQIEHIGHRGSGRLSGGERRLLQLAVAMVGSLPVMILDEPTNELSPQRRHRVWNTLRELNKAQRTTIILVTHDAIEAEKIVQRVGILRAGQLVALGQPQDLKRRISQQLRLEFFSERNAPPTLSGLPVQRIASGHWVSHLPRTQLDYALELLTRNHIVDFKLSSPTLEDIYAHYATDSP